MKKVVILMSLLSLFSFLGYAKSRDSNASLHELSFKDIDGKERSLSEFKGKVLLFVNTASECGFTGQYADLEKIHEEYKDRGFSVLGFPSNDFGGQEPGNDKQIKFFCEQNYKVSFPMFAKSAVKGEAQNPIFKFLTTQAGSGILWNFEKFLVDGEGRFVERWRSITKPGSSSIRQKIESLLPKK
jgi:glutathione peroxidase